MSLDAEWVTIMRQKPALDARLQIADMGPIPTHRAATALRRKNQKSPKK